MQTALLKLLSALNHLGFDQEQIGIAEWKDSADRTELAITFHQFKTSSVVVTIADFWRYPTVPCYFVNFSHPNGDFMACQGTPHIEKALFDLGTAFHAANASQLREEN